MELQKPLHLSSHNLFFCSDLHFGHKNILRYTDRHIRYGEPLEGLVKENMDHWKSVVARMDEDIVSQWNSVVTPDSTVILLGDNGFLSKGRLTDYLERLNGEIHLVVGNHDEHLPDRFASVTYYLEAMVDGQGIVFSHYPFYRWAGCSKGSWHLHGHEHGNIRTHEHSKTYKIMDVGIDCHPEFRPFSMSEVRSVMNNRVNPVHHNEI